MLARDAIKTKIIASNQNKIMAELTKDTSAPKCL